MPRIPFRSFGPKIRPKANPVDLFGNPVVRPKADPIPTVRNPPPKAIPDEPIGRFDVNPMGRSTESDPLDAIQRMLDFRPAAKDGSTRFVNPPPAYKGVPPTEGRNNIEHALNDLGGVNQISRLYGDSPENQIIRRNTSDVADPLNPSPNATAEDFSKSYLPGEVEKALTTGIDAPVAEDAISKMGSLANRMGQDEYIRLMQELDVPQDRTGADLMDTIDSALSLTSPDPNPRPALGGDSASLPISALDMPRTPKVVDEPPVENISWGVDLDARQRALDNAKRGTSDVTKRIKRQWVGTPRPDGPPGGFTDQIGTPMRETPWGTYSKSFAENPMGREVAVNVGDTVELKGSPLRGKIHAITGGPKKIDTDAIELAKKGEDKNWSGKADDLDFSETNFVTSLLEPKVPQQKKKVSERVFNKDTKKWETQEKWVTPDPYISRKQAIAPNMARVETADGKIRQVPLTSVKRISSAQKVDDPGVRSELADIQRLLRDPKAPIDGSALAERSAKLPPDVAPIRPGGQNAPDPSASKNPRFQLANPLPDAGGRYVVRDMDPKTGKPIGDWYMMDKAQAIRKKIVDPEFRTTALGNKERIRPDVRRRNDVGPKSDNPKHLEAFAKLAQTIEGGNKEGKTGGTFLRPSEVGSIQKAMIDGKETLVRIDEVTATKDRKKAMKWTPTHQKIDGKWAKVRSTVDDAGNKIWEALQNGKWVKLAVAGAVAGGGLLASEDEAEAGPRLPFKIGQVATKQHAPTVEVHSLPLGTRFKTAAANQSHIVESGGTRIENYLGPDQVDPETNPRNTHSILLRGGLAPNEKNFDEVKGLMQDIASPDDMTFFESTTNLKNYDRTLKTIAAKRDQFLGEADEADLLGDADKAFSLRTEAANYDRRLREGRAVPEGYTQDEIAKDLADINAQMTPEQRVKVEKAQNGIYALTKRLLTEARDEGLISEEQHAFYTSRGDDYLPMYRLGELFDPETGALIRTKYLKHEDFRANAARASLIDDDVIDQKIEGSAKTNVHPLEAVIKYIDGLGGEMQRNKAARAALTFYEKQQPTIDKMIAEGQTDMSLYKMKRLGNEKPPGEAPPGRAYVGFMEKGLPVFYDVDADFGTAMTHVEPDIMRGAAKLTGDLRLFMHMAVASANPAFMLTQVVKDPIAATIKLNPNKYTGPQAVNPGWFTEFAPRLGRDLVAGYVADPLSWGAKKIGGTGEVGKKFGDRLRKGRFNAEPEREMARSGSVNAYTDPKETVFGFTKGVWDQETSIMKKLVRTAMYGGQKIIQHGLQPAETATKNASYDLLRANKFGPVEAGAATRKYGGSPDFNTHGATTQKMKNGILFIEPWMAGMSATLESAKENPAGWIKYATLTTLGLAEIHRRNSQVVDENGKSELSKIPDSDKQGNIILFKPGPPEQTAVGDMRQPYWKLPIPHELQLMLAPAIAVMNGVDNPKYTAAQGALDIASNFIPGGGQLSAENPGEFIDSLGRRGVASLNPAFKVPIEVGKQKEMLTNTPIVGTRVGGLMPEYQKTLRTPPAAEAIARKLGTSPDQTAYAMKNLLPGLGSMIAEGIGSAIGTPDRLTQSIESPTERGLRAPVSGQFARRFNGSISTNADMSRMREMFYSFKDQTQSAANTLSGLGKRNPWELQSLPKNATLLASINPQMTKFQTALSQIDQIRELTVRNPGLDPTSKQSTLRSLFEAEERIMNATSDLIGRIQKGQ